MPGLRSRRPTRVGWLGLLHVWWWACSPAADDAARAEAWLGLPVRAAPSQAPDDKLSPGLRRTLSAPDAPPRLRVMVDLSLQVDLHLLGRRLRERGAPRLERRAAVVAALGRLADSTQARLRPAVERLRQRGLVESYEGFAVVNRLLLVATPDAVRALVRRDEVAAVVEERIDVTPILTAVGAAATARQAARSWALGAIGADAAWRRGLDGRGVVVGIIDAGASRTHEQLRDGYRDGPGSWYDPAGGSGSPGDMITGHGTAVLSAAVGRNVAGKVVGVAPGARWVACVGVPNGRFSNVALTQCADWILTTAQPDVLVNAWVLPAAGCDTSLKRIVDAWRAAEIVPVFAAGNHGPQRASDRSPGNYTGLYPGDGTALAIGGVAADDAPHPRSSRGPGSCDGSTYPALVAPATEVLAAFPLGVDTYIETDGTSVAAGLVAGAAALLLQAHPEASVVDLETALRSSAVDLGAPGPDPVFGYGRLWVPAAVDSLERSFGRRESAKPISEAPTQR